MNQLDDMLRLVGFAILQPNYSIEKFTNFSDVKICGLARLLLTYVVVVVDKDGP